MALWLEPQCEPLSTLVPCLEINSEQGISLFSTFAPHCSAPNAISDRNPSNPPRLPSRRGEMTPKLSGMGLAFPDLLSRIFQTITNGEIRAVARLHLRNYRDYHGARQSRQHYGFESENRLILACNRALQGPSQL